MFEGQPKGLYALALANTGERFGYYTMLAIFTLFLQAKFGFTATVTSNIFAGFLALVYFLPVIGGILADKFGFGKMVTSGIVVMFVGYVCLAIPTGNNAMGVAAMIGSLVLIALGTGLCKGNLQVMVGNLYGDPKYAAKRDTAFSIFYMAINIGALFAPTAAEKITTWYMGKVGLTYNGDIPALAHQYLDGSISSEALTKFTALAAQQGAAVEDPASLTQFAHQYIDTLSTSYHWGFAVACVSLIVSMLIYVLGRKTFKHADVQTAKADQDNQQAAAVQELSPEETKSRVVALCLVFAVVIFFWMAFHQNGLTLTFFARDYTASEAHGWMRIGFDVWNLVLIAIAVYAVFAVFQSKTSKAKGIAGLVTAASLIGLYFNYTAMGDTPVEILPQKFQQFNPFFVVALTPVSMAVFSALASRGKEPSAPRKIGIGMFIAAVGFAIMAIGSLGLPVPDDLANATGDYRVTPNLLIGTYLVLTFAELFLSPMGISFVSKVAPPKYKGLMMGGWFAATAVGNYLVSIIGMLWGSLPLYVLWGILVALCLVSALFIFAIMKRLEKVC